MPKYLIDVNLPSRLSIFNTDDFEYVINLNDRWADSEVWEYARLNNLTIITKDVDFSLKILTNNPPPKVIHLKVGNLKFNDFYSFITLKWSKITEISNNHKLTNVFINRIEGIN